MGRRGKLSPNKPSSETLRREYWDEYLSLAELSVRYDVTSTTIHDWLKAYNIPGHPPGWRNIKKILPCAVEGCNNTFSVAMSMTKIKFCETHRRINPPSLPDDQIPIVIEEYASGKTTYEIGSDIGYSAHHVRAVLIKAGIKLRPSNARHHRNFPKKDIIAQYESGQNIEAIARRLQTSCTKIAEILKDHPVFIQRHHARPYPFDEAVRRYLEDHEPISWLSRRYNVPHKRIADDFREHNIPLKTRKTHWKHGIKCIDGHVVRSWIERRVDDWLYSHGLLHAYEHDLPNALSGDADFFVAPYYIEVWGVERSPAYTRRKKQKIAAYEANNLLYISINAEDTQYGLDLLLAPLLNPLPQMLA